MHNLPGPECYTVLSQQEQEALCKEILAEVASGQFKPAGEPSRAHWDQVWANQWSAIPYYIRPATVLRVNGRFVRPKDPGLETAWYLSFRDRLLTRYFKEAPAIYEFGCGNGWNLEAARDMYRYQKAYMGLDWSPSAIKRLPSAFQGRVFDFFRPDYSLKLAPGAGVWTVGALEQTGTKWEFFLQYLLHNKPAVCVHVEPFVEWYEPTNPVDQTAIQYHLARNYWTGFRARMLDLEAEGKVEVLEQQRSYFGSKYIEGYSLFVWRPL